MCLEIIIAVTIGALSILVVFLMGWQALTVFRIKKKINRMERELKVQMQKDIVQAKYDASGMALAQMGLTMRNQNDYGNAMQLLLNALSHLDLGSKDEDYNKNAKLHAVRLLDDMAAMPGLRLENITPRDKSLFIDAAGKIEDKDKREQILKLILDASTKQN